MSIKKCLKCQKDFRSDGPGNRLCNYCRNRNREAFVQPEAKVFSKEVLDSLSKRDYDPIP